MKKLIPLFIIGLLFLTGCGNSKKSNSEKFYDEDAINNLATSLNNRWEYTDSKEYNNVDTIDAYKKSTQIEIDTLHTKDFSEKKFKDNKLKELYLSYENKMNDIAKMLDTTSTISLPEKWFTLYDERTKIITQINSIKEIPVKNKDALKELVNNGNEVKETEVIDTKLDALLSTIKFSEQPQEFQSDYKVYESNIENTTGKSFKNLSAKVYLENQDGVRVDTQYINISDWIPGQKVNINFSTNKTFTKTTVVKDYYTLDN
ncbi:FxLYD domain-containing protein [Lactococcus formosensis]|uniref:FxLYD domain-containing protein n=1 Tax=Lactococcus formosensis TaxID=1281486 RepID=UPI001F0509C5|nr:FxLYD domain-containing protein [Lactococcus formosensis]MCH1723610.1 FxLYD domain-containing protein [Lactococcus formosensis]